MMKIAQFQRIKGLHYTFSFFRLSKNLINFGFQKQDFEV